ncbi:hypothetical protein Y032_0006g3046 [Ancylostoma ceylanicum]|uniref:TIL domain-containing protein n=1 Tax=Ancylostoma ceylanicum TaxID=53326 RepID=A0A016VQK6_9BILA|nr:hypothetical protein Y032_0006g3046 [Ancylostoma ceylanicum]
MAVTLILQEGCEFQGPCVPRCECKEGYARDREDNCVPEGECLSEIRRIGASCHPGLDCKKGRDWGVILVIILLGCYSVAKGLIFTFSIRV